MVGGNEPGRVETGRTLRCEEAKPLLMAYIDGELEGREVGRIEDHLAVCVGCRHDERSFRKLEEVTGTMAERTVPRADIEAAWATIYARLERGLGWILLSVGLVVLAGYGLWELLSEFLLDPDAPLVARIGVGTSVAGAIVLLVSIVRETWFKYKSERYREVQR